MEAQTVLTADYLDILFENRNKQYGGYQLRKQYESSIRKGLFFILLLGAASFTLIDRSEPVSSTLPREIVTEISPLDAERPPAPPPPKAIPTPPPPAPSPTVSMTPPAIVEDHMIRESQMPDVQQLARATPGLHDAGGSGDPALGQATGDPGVTGGNLVVEPPPTKALTFVEQMPEFDGVLNTWLGSQLRYPALARENNIQGKVSVQFIVNEDGSVSDARVMRGIGGGCDEEALRVVKQMPLWKPGKQNGRPVKVLLVLPVFFRLD